jgi:hypothetical protein
VLGGFLLRRNCYNRSPEHPVPFIDTSALEVIERLPGWYGRYFNSPSMTFAHYDFKRGSSIHELSIHKK